MSYVPAVLGEVDGHVIYRALPTEGRNDHRYRGSGVIYETPLGRVEIRCLGVNHRGLAREAIYVNGELVEVRTDYTYRGRWAGAYHPLDEQMAMGRMLLEALSPRKRGGA